MRKIFNYTICCMILLLSANASGQQEGGKCTIATVARYKDAIAEIRWLPNNKSILRLGFNKSYIIQRSDSGLSKFGTIAYVKAADKATWTKLIETEKDTETKSDLETAMEFLFAGNTADPKPFNMEAGIGDMNDAKSKEDMVYALFVLSAMKNSKTAEALGLGYVDKTVRAGKTYQYRIKLDASSNVYNIEDGLVSLKAVTDPNKYKNEVFVYTGDTKLSFVWSANPELNGYYVERATEGQPSFKPLNTRPFYDSKGSGFEGASNGAYEDDSLINYKWYRYRFYGTTAFGEKILFAEVKGMPRDLTPPEPPVVKQPKHIKPKEVAVTWEINGNISDLKGFIVGRSERDSGDFKLLHKKLLSPAIRNYTDTGFNSGSTNYYVVYALDTAGNISASYPAYVALTDSTPPAKPQILSAIIDTLGVVTLTVKQGIETDLKGYRLYKANDAAHELSVIAEAFKKDKTDSTNLKLVFTDTVSLNSLTSKIYYKIKALDYTYNQSVFSDFVIVKRPDTIPPISPVFTKVLVKETQVELLFAPSESEDVKEQIVYRKTEPEASWTILTKISPAQKQVIDTNVKTGIIYYYTLRAMDESGLYSAYANPVYGKPYDSGIRPDILNIISGILDKKVVLKWDYPALKTEVYFIVYKKNSSGQLVQVARIKDKSYTDINTGKDNVYAIKAITADGGQSALSKLVTQKAE